MAVGDTNTTRRFRATFALNSNDERTFTIPNPKTDLSAAAASAFMTAMVENGDAFADPLKSALKADVVTTTTQVLVDNT